MGISRNDSLFFVKFDSNFALCAIYTVSINKHIIFKHINMKQQFSLICICNLRIFKLQQR